MPDPDMSALLLPNQGWLQIHLRVLAQNREKREAERQRAGWEEERARMIKSATKARQDMFDALHQRTCPGCGAPRKTLRRPCIYCDRG